MSFSIRPDDTTLEEGLRRIAMSQIEKAAAELADEALDPFRKAHQARKRCKKVRSVVKLAKGSLKSANKENKAFRDMARALAPARDAAVMIEACEALKRDLGARRPPAALSRVVRKLAVRRDAAAFDADLEARLADVASGLEKARRRVERWRFEQTGFDAAADGAGLAYDKARRDMLDAFTGAGPETLHEWRKPVKTHACHLRVLKSCDPEALGARIEAARRLAALLGAHHDLHVLAETLRAEPSAFGGQRLLGPLHRLIASKQDALEDDAFALGRRLFAGKPKRAVKTLRAAWEGWRAAPDEADDEALAA